MNRFCPQTRRFRLSALRERRATARPYAFAQHGDAARCDAMSRGVVSQGNSGHRRGFASGWLLVSLVVILAAAGLTWNLGLLAEANRDLRAGCEAAALAAAIQLLDPDVLRGEGQLADNIAAAQAAAQRFAWENQALGQPIALAPNPDNDPEGDVVVGYVPYPEQLGCPLIAYQPGQQANSVLVRSVRNRQRGNPVALLAGNLIGLTGANVSSQARASLDYHIAGFRPGVDTTIPVVPLAADLRSWLDQLQAEAVAGENDRITVNYSELWLDSGPDGIPEIELRAPLASSGEATEAGSLVQLLLGGTGKGDAGGNSLSNPALAQQQTIAGLSRLDLAALGGELSLMPEGCLWLPLNAQFAADWTAPLEQIHGQLRIWPLGHSDGDAFCIEGFAAAVLIGAWIDDSCSPAELVVLLQPAVMATSTAIIDPRMPNNPWIAKLMLTQ